MSLPNLNDFDEPTTSNPAAHIHVYPVDPGLSADEAWRELCIFGQRVTNTGDPTWAVITCDGEECRLMESA